MATKDELIAGMRFVVQEARRTGSALSADDWARASDMDGWKNNQILAHVAGTGGLVVPFVSGLANAPAGTDAAASFDIDALNAQMVAQRAGKSIADLVAEIDTAYSGVADWLRTAPDETLEKRATVGGYKDVPVSELMMRMVVLHGLAHIYSAYSAVMGPLSRA
jgi:hypothetical protein